MAFLVFLLLFTAETAVEGAIILVDKNIQMRCVKPEDTIESFPKINKTEVNEITIKYCPAPKVSYQSALENLNIKVDKLKTLKIFVMDIKDKTFVNGRKLTTQYQTIITEDTAKFAYFLAYINTAGDPLMSSIGKMCEGNMHSNLSSIIPFNRINTPQVSLSLGCPNQNFPYINIFKTFNINYEVITKLRVDYNVFYPTINATVLNGLTLTELNINKQMLKSNLEDGFFDSQLKTLTKLQLRNIVLKQFGENNILTDVVLLEAKTFDAFGGCTELERLELSQTTVEFKTGWLEKCSKLKKLVMYQMTEENIVNVLVNVKELTSLSIRSAAMITLSENLLRKLTKLRNVTISKVRLQTIEEKSFNENRQLMHVDLSGNVLDSGFELIRSIQDSKSIEILDASNNQNLDFCVNKGQQDPRFMIHNYQVLPPLTMVFLNSTGMTHMCFRHFKHLTYLDLSNNNIRKLKFDDLPSFDNQSLIVNLEKNPLAVPDSKEDYLMMLEKFKNVKNITIKVDVILDCDCKYAWYFKAIRSLPQLKINSNCKQGSLKAMPKELLECTKWNCDSCICRTSWKSNETEVDCKERGLTSIPKFKDDVKFIIASNNLIHTLKKEDFRDDIKSLDLRRNYISRVSPEIVPQIFLNGRNIWISGNPIICDCDNQEFILALQKTKDQVKDYNNVTCADGTTRVELIDGLGLCEAEKEREVLVITASIGTLLALIALSGVLVYRYQQEIKVYLFARGFCMWFLKEDILDSHKHFDAFISFSHHDEEFVASELLPNLDKCYSICIHTRNWVPGEMISTQIIQSVECSRRTIIVLSRNFVDSVWGMMEFKTAHISALREGRARVIVVVLDDVIDDENIDEELKRYLKNNTYLKWGDNFFWDKMKYALPHYPRAKNSSNINELDEIEPHVTTPESSSVL